MISSKVFAIDTSVFVSDRLNWTLSKYRMLLELAEDGLAIILIPDVVKHEVLKKITEHSYEIEKSWKEFKDKAHGIFLVSDEMSKIFEGDFNREEFFLKLKKSFENFLDSKGVQVVSNEDVSVDEIMRQYFSQTPPFRGSNK